MKSKAPLDPALSPSRNIRYRHFVMWLALLSSILLATAWLASCNDAPARASQADQSRPHSSITDTFLPLNIKPHGLPGVINDLNLAVSGIDSWRSLGDAYSPEYIAGATPNPEHDTQPYGYLFRVDIPADFPDNHTLVQIFDPDNYNKPDLPPTPYTPIPTATFCPFPCSVPTATPYATPTLYGGAGEFTYCWGGSDCTTNGARYDVGLKLGAFPLTATPIPTVFNGTRRTGFWRMDEMRLPHDACCINPSGNEWSDTWVDTTTYTLWHFDPNITNPLDDPTLLSDQPGGAYLTSYTVGNDSRTDLSWYQPAGYDIKLSDAADPNCSYPNHDCYARQANGHFYFYIYAQTLSGSSANNFDLRVGPKAANYAAGYDCSNVNNLLTTICPANQQYFIQSTSANPPPDWDSGGSAPATISAVRAMDINLNTGDHFPMLLAQVSSDLAGNNLSMRHFDQDCTNGCGPTHTMQYQMQLCVIGGGGTYEPCSDITNNNCFGDAGTGYVGPNNDWYCVGCPNPETVPIPQPGTTAYTQFFGPNGECSTSWLRLKSDPSYSQDDTTWEVVIEATPSATPTWTPAPMPTSTQTPTTVPSSTPTNTPTNLPTHTPTNTPTDTPTHTPTNTPTGTFSPTSTDTPTDTPVPPTSAATNTGVPTQPDTATATPTGAATNIATGTSTDTATPPAETGTPQATVTACNITFSDVSQGNTFYAYIHCLVCMGIVNGYADGTFRPGNNVTRGQLAKIVSNSAGFNDTQSAQLFEDVLPGSVFFDYIGRLASRGYMSGYPCGGLGESCGSGNLPYFRPSSNSTRGQISKIVANAAGFADAQPDVLFQDVPLGQPFHDYIGRLASRGFMNGYPCGVPGEPCGPSNLPYFRPGNNASRGQTAKIVANTFFPDCRPVH